jgi:hypothetical protein
VEGYVKLWHPSGTICLSGQPIVHGHEALGPWMKALLDHFPPRSTTSWDMTYHVDPAVKDGQPTLVQAQGIQTIHAGEKELKSFGNVTLVKDGASWKLLTVAGVSL